ncbi:MAG: penicillin-binding protein, partial [Propionibacteriaceae bacterium]|nr:penicillin-binding protein [Propionibacteriaceae bacterium]
GKPKRKKKPLPLRIFLWLLVGVLTLAVGGLAAVAVYYAAIPLPKEGNEEFQTNTTFIYYKDGKKELGSFQVQNRQSISYKDMNPNAVNAIVGMENRTFWDDPGISVPSMFRATWAALTGEEVTGASTITQQYVKVYYLTQEKTLTRKIREIFIAAKIGQEMPKEMIIANYLNTVYFGRGAYGLQAASEAYFDKDQSKLTLQEAVALVCIVNNPTNLDPANGDKQAADLLERYQYALNGMRELDRSGRLVGDDSAKTLGKGAFTEAQKAEIYRTLPKFPKVKTDSKMGGTKGYLLQMVKDELVKKGFSEQEVSGGGLRVTTTFDPDAQAAAVQAAQDMTEEASGGDKKKIAKLHAAIASIDNETGGMLAIYGGPDYLKSYINWATTPRPTGSTFKPYALTAALRDGWDLYYDYLNGNSFTPKGDKTPVTNGGYNYGRISLLRATTKSVNSAYVDLVTQLPYDDELDLDGPRQVMAAANDAGAPTATDWTDDNRIALGKAMVSPYYQAAAYSTFAHAGCRWEPHVVASVTDANGRTLYTGPTECTEDAIEPTVANNVAYALGQVANDGTGYRAKQLGYPVAGKTGTAYVSTKDKTKTVASWFVGFTRQITTSVMYVAGDGYDNLDDYSSGFYGSGYPTRTWLAYMLKAMDGKEREELPTTYVRDTDTQQADTSYNRTTKAAAKPEQVVQPTIKVKPTATKTTAKQTEEATTEAPTTQAPPAQPATSEPAAVETQPAAETIPPADQATSAAAAAVEPQPS